jgi:hypothetical protein
MTRVRPMPVWASLQQRLIYDRAEPVLRDCDGLRGEVCVVR